MARTMAVVCSTSYVVVVVWRALAIVAIKGAHLVPPAPPRAPADLPTSYRIQYLSTYSYPAGSGAIAS